MIERALRSAYERLGPRYPHAAVVGQIQLGYLVWLVTVAVLSVYVDMSVGEFLRLLAFGLVIFVVHNLFYARIARRLLGSVIEWLGGERDPREAGVAWAAAACLPRELLRRDLLRAPLAAIFWGGTILWSIYAAWELDFPVYAAVALLIAAPVYLAYYLSLSFFLVERVMRPVLTDIASQLRDDAALEVPGIPLRWRMLGALPAINVITGVVVGAALSHGNGLGDLALAVAISIAVAATISLALTLLLSDSVSAPVRSLSDATEKVREGDFGARVPVTTTDEIGGLARAFNRMVSGLQERERLREAFGTFVDPDLAERVARDGTDLRGEELEISIMFMDIRGFTSFSESAEAREVVARLNELYEVVVPVITDHGGHANKFIGDGLLAVFGAPERQPDHADRAVAAALEIANRVRDRFSGDLSVGLGVNTGPVVVGTIGGGGRLDFTVIGDAVNTAARVESTTRKTGDDVLITESTKGQLSDEDGGWVERPAIPLKGKAEEVRLYAPASAGEESSDEQVTTTSA